MYTIEAITSFDRFTALEPVWNRLLEQSDQDVPFLTFEWFSSWWKSFGNGKQMLVLVLKKRDEPVAIAPFMLSKTTWRGFPVRAVTFMTDALSSRNGIIAAEKDLCLGEHIFRYLQNRKLSYDIMHFDLIVRDSLTYGAFQHALTEIGLPYVEMQSYLSPFIKINGTWDDYLNSRSKNFRSKMKLTANRFNRQKLHEVVTYSAGSVPQGIEDLLHVSRRTWKFKDGTAIASNPRSVEFIRTFSELAARKGWLNLRILKLEGKPVAFLYNLEYKGRIFYYKTGFDEKYRNISSGEFLNHEAIKESFEKNFREYDLLGRNESYKMRLTSLCREHRKYIVFNTTFLGKMLYSVETKLLPVVKRFIRRSSEEAVPALKSLLALSLTGLSVIADLDTFIIFVCSGMGIMP
jgi:CelD/BcsL family acetyltransferase involved in cellulose biosynthesis